MTLDSRKALDLIQSHLEEFEPKAQTGTIEILILHGRPQKIRVMKNEEIPIASKK